MDSEKLKTFLKDDEVRKEILNRLQPKEWMNMHEAADYLSLSIRSLYRLIKDNRIPYKYIPGTKKIRFMKRQLDLWIITGKNIVTDHIPVSVLREIKKNNDI